MAEGDQSLPMALYAWVAMEGVKRLHFRDVAELRLYVGIVIDWGQEATSY
jgi:hypothetical protein